VEKLLKTCSIDKSITETDLLFVVTHTDGEMILNVNNCFWDVCFIGF